jgi:hypothetical protein
MDEADEIAGPEQFAVLEQPDVNWNVAEETGPVSHDSFHVRRGRVGARELKGP